MQTHNLTQGGSEWLAHRARIFNASEAPAMMGASKYATRAALLHEKATGITPEVSPALQALFDRGHAAEAAARPLIEDLIGDDLAPLVGTVEIDGMTIGSSFDGITFMRKTVAEVKLWNEGLADQVRAGILDMHYVWQLEQGLLVSGAERVVFVCTDGTPERFVHMEYRPVAGRREQLIAGWKQFAADLATYVPSTKPVEKIVAEPVQALPAVSVQVAGEISVISNFDRFEVALRDFLEHRLIRQPKTDQDFADLDVQIKAMKGAEAALEQAEGQMLAQLASVDAAKKTKDMLHKLVRDNRLMAEKLLTSEKERRKAEIVREGITALVQHVAGLNQRIGQNLMPASATAVDFGAAIKGLRSLDSMENAIATTLANAKIEANALADRIEINLKALPGLVGDRAGLTPDLSALVLKSPEDFAAVVGQRVQAQREQEERRAAELVEKERARVRAEEEARAAAKARMEQEDELERQRHALLAEQKAAEKARQDEWLASAEAREQARQAEIAEAMLKARQDPAVAARHEAMRDAVAIGMGITQTTVAQDGTPEVKHIPAGNVLPMPTKAPADDGSRINLSDIKDRLAPIQITAEGLASLGFPHVAQEKASKLYRASDLGAICTALIRHLEMVRAQRMVA